MLPRYYRLSLMADARPERGAPPWSRRVAVLLDVASRLAGEHDVSLVLERIVDGAAVIAGARYAAIGVYDEDGRIVRFVHHGVDEATVARIGHYPEGRGLLGVVIVADQPVRLDDLLADRRACGFPKGHPPMRTFLGVPVRRAGRRYGNLYLTEKRGGEPFDDDDEALVVALATFAAGAIESAELVRVERAQAETRAELAAAEERSRVRREMLGEVIKAQEDERARVSRDLHDDVGQALTSVLLGLRLVRGSLTGDVVDLDDARTRTDEVRDLVADALRRARRLAFELRPTVLDDVGLEPALQRLAEELSASSPVEIVMVTNGLTGQVRLAPDIETVVYRVVQEALTNVVRHANATAASVTVTMLNGNRLRALIEDNGIGFDIAATGGGHLGVRGMSERADLVDGTVEVSSSPGAGTTVVLDVPL